MIWTYPRAKPPRLASIVKVAQASGFYDPQTEAELNAVIEAPANPVLERLRTDESIDAQGRERVALYVATMIKRVPDSRRRGAAILPSAIESAVQALKDRFDAAAAQGLIDARRLEELLGHVERVHGEFREKAPAEVLAHIRMPWPSPGILEAVYNMRWRVFAAEPPDMFITSDNPAYFFGAYGLATDNSELSVPLSPRRCLYGCNREMPGTDLELLRPPGTWIREVNRRVASGATSVGFAHQRRTWVANLVKKRNPHLSRFLWGQG